MFGFGSAAKIDKAVEDAYASIDAIFRPLMKSGKLVKAMKADPFVSGYVHSRLLLSCSLAAKEQGLGQDDTNKLSNLIKAKVYGEEGFDLIPSMNLLFTQKNAEFMRGRQYVQKIGSFINGAQDISKDPDFPKAMALVKGMGLPISNDMSVPLVGLERLWIGDYLLRFL